jgi:uncharacterized membrane protein YqhA
VLKRIRAQGRNRLRGMMDNRTRAQPTMKKLLENAKYLSIIGVLSLLVTSAAAFAWGVVKTYKAISLLITSYGQDATIVVFFIEVVDSLLIAIALLVFAFGMYELFIGDLNLPEWVQIHDLHELKARLSSVIILVMAVKFLEYFMELNDAANTLLYGIAVAVVSAALVLFSNVGHKD